MKIILVLFFIFICSREGFSQPALMSPIDGSLANSTSPTITWTKVPGANAYFLKLSTGNPQDPLIVNGNVGNNISKSISGLSNNTTYYVQLWSSTNGGSKWSEGSPVYSFKTEVAYVDVSQTPPVYNTSSGRSSTWKSTGIKAGVVVPIGNISDYYSTGFMVADLSKWYLSKYVRTLGRLELAFLGGKE